MTRADAFFRDASTGRFVLVQPPNPAIWVWVVATALRWSPYDARDGALSWIGAGALIVWAVDEIVRGHAPVRRVLGVLVLGWQLWRLFSGA
jgi:hypothetical protein